MPVGILAHPARPARRCPTRFGAQAARRRRRASLLAGLGVLGSSSASCAATTRAGTASRCSARSIAGAALLVAFLVWESRTTAPLLPLRLFRDRSFSIANVVGFGFSFGMFGAVFILIQFLQIVQGALARSRPRVHDHAVDAGADGRSRRSPASSRRGSAPACSSSSASLLQATGLFWLAATMSADVPYTTMLPAFIAAGDRHGPGVRAVVDRGARPHPSATTRRRRSGTNSTLREIGVALGIAVLTAVFTGRRRRAHPDRLRRRGDPRGRRRCRGARWPRRSSRCSCRPGAARTSPSTATPSASSSPHDRRVARCRARSGADTVEASRR